MKFHPVVGGGLPGCASLSDLYFSTNKCARYYIVLIVVAQAGFFSRGYLYILIIIFPKFYAKGTGTSGRIL